MPDVVGRGLMYVIRDYVVMYIICGSLGRLTKLRAYSFQIWFQVLPLVRGRVRDDCIAPTTTFSLGGFTLMF